MLLPPAPGLTLTLTATDGDSETATRELHIKPFAAPSPAPIFIAGYSRDVLAGGVDLDGDGFDDLYVQGFDGPDTDTDGSGTADTDTDKDKFVLLRGGASPTAESLAPGVAKIFDAFAASVAVGKAHMAGDLNGDGKLDFVIEEPIVGFSAATNHKLLLSGSSTEHKRLEIANSASVSGFSYADINGDGIDDVLLERPDNTGYVDRQAFHVIFGDASFPETLDLQNLGTAGIRTVALDSNNTRLGGELSGADVDGDGIDDLIIGDNRTGEIYVVYGIEGLTSLPNVYALGEEGFKITNSASRGFGDRIYSGGDINGDGVEDFIVESQDNNDNRIVSVVFGSATRLQGSFDVASTDIGFNISAGTNTELRGVLIGDVNGDGFDDVALADYEADYGGTNAGTVYILFGKAGKGEDIDLSQSVPSHVAVLMHGTPDDKLGWFGSLSAAGDVDGDGLADLLVGTETRKNHLILGKRHRSR